MKIKASLKNLGSPNVRYGELEVQDEEALKNYSLDVVDSGEEFWCFFVDNENADVVSFFFKRPSSQDAFILGLLAGIERLKNYAKDVDGAGVAGTVGVP